MEVKTRILIVEDDMLIAANLSLQLTSLGYEVTGIESRGEAAIMHVRLNPPDIILMDVNLKGELDGIDTAKAILKERDIPLIYLTANNDEATFSKARQTHPYAFISKPFNKLDLHRSIALVVEQRNRESGLPKAPLPSELMVLEDRVFVRHHGKMIKLLLEDIRYVEAERNYCNIFTANGNYLVVSTLKAIQKKLPSNRFIRVHRSYVVNIFKLDVVADNHLEIGRKAIPVSKSYKEVLLCRLHTI